MHPPDKYLGLYRIASTRCKGYDYTREGAYFLTVCTHKRQPLFGEIIRGKMQRNTLGQIVWDEWFRSAKLRTEIELDAFVVMPDHIHGIVFIQPVAETSSGDPSHQPTSPVPRHPRVAAQLPRSHRPRPRPHQPHPVLHRQQSPQMVQNPRPHPKHRITIT